MTALLFAASDADTWATAAVLIVAMVCGTVVLVALVRTPVQPQRKPADPPDWTSETTKHPQQKGPEQ